MHPIPPKSLLLAPSPPTESLLGVSTLLVPTSYISPAHKSTAMLMHATKISMAISTITAVGVLLATSFLSKHTKVLYSRIGSMHKKASRRRLKKRGEREQEQDLPKKKHTNPFQLLAMTMTQLVFQNSQQIRNDIQALIEQPHALIHLEIAPYGLVHGLELWLNPE